jgi:DNA-binding NarL/FixJ family response regulator
VDDHSLVRRTLRDRLENEADLRVVADVPDADAALEQVKEHRPDVILLDIDMPGTISFEAARTIRTHYPGTKIIFLSAFFNDRYIEQALAMEAAGYITKSEPPEKVIEGIRQVMAGATYYSPDVQSRLVVDSKGVHLGRDKQSRLSTLTPREMEVLRYIAKGLPKKQIATTMHVSLSTVDAHCARLMNKLDIHDRVELTLFAIREGLAEA